MIEKLLDLLEKLWTLASPLVIVHPWQGGIVMRLGKYHRALEQGYHPKWPLAEDFVLTETCTTTLRLEPQSLTTRDDVPVVVGSIVKYRIQDVRKYVCDVWDQKDVLADTTMGAIARKVESTTYADLRSGNPARDVIDDVREELNKFGFKVSKITFTDFCRMRSIRLVQPRAKDLDN